MAGRVNLTIDQGATWRHTFRWQTTEGVPIDLTGCTARMHVRTKHSSADVLLELTTDNGRIVITPTDGRLDLEVSATDTAALAFTKGVYDLEVVHPDASVTRLVEGSITVRPEVTR